MDMRTVIHHAGSALCKPDTTSLVPALPLLILGECKGKRSKVKEAGSAADNLSLPPADLRARATPLWIF